MSFFSCLGFLVVLGGAFADILWSQSGSIGVGVDSNNGCIAMIRTGEKNSTASGFSTLGVNGTVLQVNTSSCGTGVCVVRLIRAEDEDVLGLFRTTVVFDEFRPSMSGDAIAWSVTVSSNSSSAWRTSIRSSFGTNSSKSWVPASGTNESTWVDVLEPGTSAGRYCYGVNYAQWVPGGEGEPTSVPVWATKLEDGESVSIVHELVGADEYSPVLGLTYDVDGVGGVEYARWFNRLGGDAEGPVTHRVYFVSSGEDMVRGALRAVERLYPGVTSAVSELAKEVGLGMYSCASADAVNATFLEGSGANFLWDAKFWWPYIGMDLVPCGSGGDCMDVEWVSDLGSGEEMACGSWHHGDNASRAKIATSYQNMATVGIHTMAYFNLFEFGKDFVTPLPPPIQPPPANEYKNSSQFAADHFSGGVAYDSDGKPQYTNWQDAVILDPGNENVAEYFLEQARYKQVFGNGSFAGLAIDRADHTTAYSYNSSLQDRTAWCGVGGNCSSFLVGWLKLAARLRDALPEGSMITTNFAGANRIGLLESIDGVFSEADDPKPNIAVNLVGIATTNQPAILWTYSADDLLDCPGGPDGYLQRALYLNVFPFAPVYGADHSIQPDARVDSYYLDYGHMFQAVRGSRWYFDTPFPIRTTSLSAKTNAFIVPGESFLAFVGFEESTVKTLNMTVPGQFFKCTATVPGVAIFQTLQGTYNPSQNRTMFELPLSRGSGLLKCNL